MTTQDTPQSDVDQPVLRKGDRVIVANTGHGQMSGLVVELTHEGKPTGILAVILDQPITIANGGQS